MMGNDEMTTHWNRGEDKVGPLVTVAGAVSKAFLIQ